MLFFTLPCAPPLRPAVPAAGHARRSNKGCTKRQSLPNCQHNGRIPPYDRPGSSGPGVILAERPGRNGICQAGGRQKTGGRTRAPGNYTGNLQVARVVAGCPCPPSCFLPSSRLAYSVSPRPFCQNNTWAGAAGTVVRGNSAIMLTIWQGLPFGTTFVRSTGVTGSRNRRAKGRGTRQRKK